MLTLPWQYDSTELHMEGENILGKNISPVITTADRHQFFT